VGKVEKGAGAKILGEKEQDFTPLFRESAYTKIKKVIGESSPENLESYKEKIIKALKVEHVVVPPRLVASLPLMSTQTLMIMQNVGWKYGTDMEGGMKRFVTHTNGGPMFVYVKDDKIIRMTPITFDDTDAPSWTITARGKTFTPPRMATVAPHTMCSKSTVYSPDRLLYPMKRVDFDPHGEPVRTSDDRTYVLDSSRAGDLLVDPLETYRAIEEVRVFEPSP